MNKSFKDHRWLDSSWLPSLLLMVVAFLAYSNTFGHPWIYDDLPVIVNNPDITSWKAFLSDSYPGRPLRELSYLLDHSLFDMEPAGWHIQNNFWHGLNGILLFLLGRHLFGSNVPALLAALLFLLHPLQVEVVGHLSHRKDLLATTFVLASMLSYTHFLTAIGRKRWGWLSLTIVLAVLAYLGKQTAVALPLVFAAYELALVPPTRRVLLRWPSLVAGACAASFVAASAWMLAFGGLAAYRQAYLPILVKFNQYPPFSDANYLQMVFKAWTFMLRRLIWPVDLAPEYTFAAPVDWLDPWVLVGLALVLLVMTTLPLLFATGQKQLCFALFWFAGFFLVTANLLWPTAYLAADRYLYTPLVGFCLLVALVFWKFFRQRAAWLLPVGVVLCLVLGTLTWQQNRLWASHEKLWQHALQISPTSPTVLNNLGQVFQDKGDYNAAIGYYSRVIELNSSVLSPRYNLGLLYARQGDRFRALYYFKEYLNRADVSMKPADRRQALEVRNYVHKKFGVKL
jgi:tetratricopeptide (TPR) repeat protein